MTLAAGMGVDAAAGALSPDQALQVREAFARLSRQPEGKTAYLVITDKATGKFVQFSRARQAIEFDFPIQATLRPEAPNPLRRQSCGPQARLASPGETVRRFLSEEEERRVVTVLRTLQMASSMRYREMVDRKGQRHGHNQSLQGWVRDSDRGTRLVDAIFSDAYLQHGVQSLDIDVWQ